MDIFFIDDTFIRTPKPFYQIMSIYIHVDISSSEAVHVVGVIYALLPSELQTRRCERFYELLHLELNTRNIKCDEASLINALKFSFPQINNVQMLLPLQQWKWICMEKN